MEDVITLRDAARHLSQEKRKKSTPSAPKKKTKRREELIDLTKMPSYRVLKESGT